MIRLRTLLYQGSTWSALTAAVGAPALHAMPANDSAAETPHQEGRPSSPTQQAHLTLPRIPAPPSAPTPSPAPSTADATAPTPNTSATLFGALPKPSAPIVDSDTRTLFLELVLNGRRTGIISAVEWDGERAVLPTKDLQAAGAVFHSNHAVIALNDLPQTTGVYQESDQSLLITLPDQYLPNQRFSQGRERIAVSPAETALLLNYDAQITYNAGPRGRIWDRERDRDADGDGIPDWNDPSIPTPRQRQSIYASLFHEARLTGNFGVFSTSGLLSNSRQNRYLRYDSYYRNSDPNSATTVEVGDFITRSFTNASAVRLGGVQISRDFTVRPDIITYPMPDFSGRAALPSTVELLIDGRSLSRSAVDPGSFVLDMLPPTNGAGEAQLVVTDMHGRSVATSMPFYVASNLLARGLTDYSASAGFFRQDYGIRNFSYGKFAASGALRHGITNSLTGELRAEASPNFLLAGAGVVTKIAHYGVVSAASAFSRHHGQWGHQITVGYDYLAGPFSLSLRHQRQSAHYADLGTIQWRRAPGRRHLTSAGASLSLGNFGNVGLTYAEQYDQYRGQNRWPEGPVDNLPLPPSSREPNLQTPRTIRYINAHYSLPVHDRMRLHAQASRDFTNKGWYASLALNLAFGGRGDNVNLSVADRNEGARSYNMDYSRPIPSEGGFGWNIGGAFDERGDKNWRGDLLWRNNAMQLRAGTFGFSSGATTTQQYWAAASGALVFMQGDIYSTNRLTDAFALVTTGTANVPVRYENQLIGHTNAEGKLFIPAISPWYAGKFAIDPLGLAANLSVPKVEQRIAAAGGRGVLVDFPIHVNQPAMASLKFGPDRLVEVGSAVYADGRLVTHIGWEGLLYIEDIGPLPRESLEIREPDGTRCTVTIPWDRLTAEDWNLGELTCNSVS